jgi:hypothetical protein
MAQLSLSVIGLTWRRFLEAQLPALRLALLVAGVTFALSAVSRHLAAPSIVTLALGTASATGTAVLAAWVIPAFALGEHGLRSRNALRTYLMGRLHPVDARGSR